MAKGSNTGKKCCLAALITPLVVVVLIVAAVVVVLTLTPNKLGIADIQITEDGDTIASLGLADTKLIDIIKQLSAMTSAKESDVVSNPYDTTREESVSATALQGSNALGNYSSILNSNVVYDKRTMITYDDTTLAYIFNKAIEDAEATDTDAKKLKDYNVSVREVTIGTNSIEQGSMRVVASVDVPQQEAEDKFAVSLPEKVYITVEATITVGVSGTDEGQMTGTPAKLYINGESSALTDAILTVLNAEMPPDETVENVVVNGITSVINHLGKIGTAQTRPDDGTVYNPVFGMNGVADHKLTVITYTE